MVIRAYRLLLAPFLKLKVFQQIMVIVILVSVFLGIQGYLGIRIINQ